MKKKILIRPHTLNSIFIELGEEFFFNGEVRNAKYDVDEPPSLYVCGGPKNT